MGVEQEKMKLFNLFKKNKPLQSPAVNRSETITEKVLRKETSQISEKNKKYYQDDSYYTTTYNDIMGKPQNVITFEDRKKTCIPTSQGLYVAEILLLDYCSKGKDPNPQYGYPGFWWFEYGIRDVDKALKELENRGFITWTPLKDLINNLKVEDIKKLLSAHSQPITGNKPQLIDRLIGVISDDELLNAGLEPKYKLTETGNSELQENAYVPYMHKHSKYNNFTIWDLNFRKNR